MSSDKLAELETKLDKALKRIQTLEDVEAIKKIQYKYGYYLDKCLYNQGVECFANSPKTQAHFHGGIWKGKEGVRRLYIERFQKAFTAGRNGPVYGFLLDHPMYQAIIDIDEKDPDHAYGRFRVNMQAGLHESATVADPNHRDHEIRQWMEGALYENEFIRENGEWKILVLKYRPQWHADWDKGISYTKPEYVPFIKDVKSEKNPSGPDEVEQVWLWPDVPVLPFHYPSPGGTWLTEEEIKSPRKVYPAGSTGRIA